MAGQFCLPVCDYLGEKLAGLLGITSPKYQYAIDEYYRMRKEVSSSNCINGHQKQGNRPWYLSSVKRTIMVRLVTIHEIPLYTYSWRNKMLLFSTL